MVNGLNPDSNPCWNVSPTETAVPAASVQALSALGSEPEAKGIDEAPPELAAAVGCSKASREPEGVTNLRIGATDAGSSKPAHSILSFATVISFLC